MKMIVLTTVFFLLVGCATTKPADFANRCTIEGYGPESANHQQCTHYYARMYTAQRQYAMGRALSAGGKAILEQDQRGDSITCTTFGDITTCDRH